MAGWDYQVGEEPPQQQALPEGATRVCILIPHRDDRDYRPFHRRFMEMQKPAGMGWLEMRGFSLCTNRENLVKTALKALNYTHLFFLDDDVLPPVDIIPQLVAADLDIVCGLYMAKKAKAERGLAAWVALPEGLRSIEYDQNRDGQERRWVECDVTGLGCAMIKRHVFERLSEPWFRWDVPPAPSEDFYFFFKTAHELGIKPIIDMNMKCGHLGSFVLDCDGTFETPQM